MTKWGDSISENICSYLPRLYNYILCAIRGMNITWNFETFTDARSHFPELYRIHITSNIRWLELQLVILSRIVLIHIFCNSWCVFSSNVNIFIAYLVLDAMFIGHFVAFLQVPLLQIRFWNCVVSLLTVSDRLNVLLLSLCTWCAGPCSFYSLYQWCQHYSCHVKYFLNLWNIYLESVFHFIWAFPQNLSHKDY